MKKQLLLTFAFLFLFSILGWGQRTTWKLNFKSNYSIVDIEDATFYFSSVGFGNQLTVQNDFSRSGKGKSGIELGIKAIVEIEEGIKIISGLEAKFIHFNRIEEIELNSPDDRFVPVINSNAGINEIIQGDYIVRDLLGNPINSKIEEGVFKQKLYYLNIPLNVGYSSKSNRWTFYGGLWYSRLIASVVDGTENYDVEQSNDLFNKNIIGFNVGLDVNVFKKIGLIINYKGVGSNIYRQEKHYFPTSVRVHLFSFGMTYQLNNFYNFNEKQNP